jgi:hypothetical protein
MKWVYLPFIICIEEIRSFRAMLRSFAFNTRFQLPPLRPVEKLTGLAPHSFQSNS